MIENLVIYNNIDLEKILEEDIRCFKDNDFWNRPAYFLKETMARYTFIREDHMKEILQDKECLYFYHEIFHNIYIDEDVTFSDITSVEISTLFASIRNVWYDNAGGSFRQLGKKHISNLQKRSK